MRVRRIIPSAVVAVAAALLLTACPGPPPGLTPTTPATGSPAPTSEGLAEDVAFEVIGTLVSPDSTTEIGFRMTVGAPQAETPSDVTLFETSVHCPPESIGEPSPIADPQYVHVEVVTDLIRGDASGAEVVIGTSSAPGDWRGDYASGQASCAEPLARPIPGTATGTIMVESGSDVGPLDWFSARSGYGLSAVVIDPATTEATTFTVASCAIEFGPASQGTIAADLISVDAGLGCFFGLGDS